MQNDAFTRRKGPAFQLSVVLIGGQLPFLQGCHGTLFIRPVSHCLSFCSLPDPRRSREGLFRYIPPPPSSPGYHVWYLRLLEHKFVRASK